MPIQSNVSLELFNTLGVPAKTAWMATINSTSALQALIKNTLPHHPIYLVLGGGSNVLFATDYPGLIIHNQLLGTHILEETDEYILVQVGAGIAWHTFVLYCLENNWYGLENLSLIPGSIGASPVQNIGAYGVEVESCITQLNAIHLTTGELTTFNHADCKFGYRSSIFKHAFKGQYCITDVTFKLNKQPQLELSYGAIQLELEKRGIQQPTPRDVSDVVIDIRQQKLPDPSKIPNAGSFFKNPVIELETFNKLQSQHQTVPHYLQPNDQVKIPAAWLIEQCGLKDFTLDGVSTYDKHALVIINPMHRPGQDVLKLVQHIQAHVKAKFGIQLEPEVNIIN